MTFLDLKESFFKRYSHIVIILKNKEMKKKVYEMPAILVYNMSPRVAMLQSSTGDNGTGDVEQGARYFWFDEEDEENY